MKKKRRKKKPPTDLKIPNKILPLNSQNLCPKQRPQKKRLYPL
jgi:hypothetical protein